MKIHESIIRENLYHYIEHATDGKYTKQQLKNGAQVPPLFTENMVIAFVQSMLERYSEDIPF